MRRVIKVGGSLFAQTDLPARLSNWLDRQSPASNLLLSGGGELADAIRVWEQRFALPPAFSHWLCVDLMGITARILAQLLPDAKLVTRLEEIPAGPTGQSRTAVFNPSDFVRELAVRQPESLPCDWSVTSDSIAAVVARTWEAELVLLKSVRPSTQDPAELAQQGIVDEFFPQALRGVKKWSVVRLGAVADQS